MNTGEQKMTNNTLQIILDAHDATLSKYGRGYKVLWRNREDGTNGKTTYHENLSSVAFEIKQLFIKNSLVKRTHEVRNFQPSFQKEDGTWINMHGQEVA